MKKYLIVGGPVTSKTDGDVHYINANKLLKLYGLNPEECILLEGTSPLVERYLRQGLVCLSARFNGDYLDVIKRLEEKEKC